MILLYVGLHNGKIHYATTDDESAKLASEDVREEIKLSGGFLEERVIEITPALLEKI